MEYKSQDKEINCNFENEFTLEDEKIIKNLNLTEDQLKLRYKDINAFWKQVAECIRSDLSDQLEDNQELHRLQELMEEENKDLLKENSKLIKLVNEAKEICSQYME